MENIQFSIRRNADDYKEIVEDLGDWLGDLNTKKRTLQEKEAPLKKVSVEDQDEAFIAKEKGNFVFKKGQYKKAIKFYSEAIEKDPTVAVYYLNRGVSYLKLSNFANAKSDCDDCLRIDPKNVKGLYRRALAFIGLGQLKCAEADLQQGLVLEPSNKVIRDELALLKGKVLLEANRKIDSNVDKEKWQCNLDIIEINEPKQFY